MPDPVMPTPAMDGDALRWVDTGFGSIDLMHGDVRAGWVSPIVHGWRGYFIDLDIAPLPKLRMEDHPDEPSARAWVEEQVRRQGEGRNDG